mgnify:CR=1 FL=1
MTALKKLKVAIPATAPESTKPTVSVPGDLVTQYNEANRVAKDAEKLMAKLAPDLKQAALEHLYGFNIEHPTAPLTTVAVQDEEGSSANVSFKNAYGKEVDEAKALAALESVGCQDPNLYLAESLKVTFDGSAFVDENGDVRLAYYRAMQAAAQSVADKFGLPNPLATKKVVTIRPAFHESRFAMWPTVKAQEQLTESIPNQISLTPIKD